MFHVLYFSIVQSSILRDSQIQGIILKHAYKTSLLKSSHLLIESIQSKIKEKVEEGFSSCFKVKVFNFLVPPLYETDDLRSAHLQRSIPSLGLLSKTKGRKKKANIRHQFLSKKKPAEASTTA